jgi:hypothetical protein
VRFHVCEVLVEVLCAAAPDVETPELLGFLAPFLAQLRAG